MFAKGTTVNKVYRAILIRCPVSAVTHLTLMTKGSNPGSVECIFFLSATNADGLFRVYTSGVPFNIDTIEHAAVIPARCFSLGWRQRLHSHFLFHRSLDFITLTSACRIKVEPPNENFVNHVQLCEAISL